jgi:formylmethanofuran dehydrogenase subunit E
MFYMSLLLKCYAPPVADEISETVLLVIVDKMTFNYVLGDRMETAKGTSFQEVTKFHGHICPGTIIGYRAAQIAVREFSSKKSVDEELITIVENDSCSVDAIQVVTGCTFGKGNLIFKDYGKHVYTFINRETGGALRISLNSSVNLEHMDPTWSRLRRKVSSGSATSNEQLDFRKRADIIAEKLMNMPEGDLFNVRHIEIANVPKNARIFRSVTCQKCGELVSEHRVRLENGETVCIPCSAG